MSGFTQFNFHENIQKALTDIGFETPTPIQAQVIPKVFEGVDIIASASTGTGKTGAFMLPILHMLTDPAFKAQGGPQVLILVPTRELAIQVADEAKKFSKYLTKTKTVCIYGGVPYPIQKKALSGMYEILVATPGRLLDHVEQGRIDLSKIKLLVLDEADRMLDMGFVADVEYIAKCTPENRQTLLFSATIDRRILPFSQKMQKTPHRVAVESNTSTSTIEQFLYYVDNIDHKLRLLDHLLENTSISQGIVFTSTKRQADILADYMDEKGYKSEAMHGDMNQRQRTRTIGKLRTGHIQFLVATDVAARGIDIPALSHVINFDIPFQAEDFVHRVGRTGRAGADGVAITFATFNEDFRIDKIGQLLGAPLQVLTVEGLEPKPQVKRGSFRGRRQGSDDRNFRGNGGRSKPGFGSRNDAPREQKPWKKKSPAGSGGQSFDRGMKSGFKRSFEKRA